MAHRERRVLRVVFPSFVDGGGNLHEPRIVHAVVDDGAWMQLSGSEPTAIDQIEGRTASLASAAFTPPTLPDAATLPSDMSPAPEVKPAPAGPPSAEAVAAARAKGAALKAGSAIDAIRAEVQSRLAQTAKAPVAVPPVFDLKYMDRTHEVVSRTGNVDVSLVLGQIKLAGTLNR